MDTIEVGFNDLEAFYYVQEQFQYAGRLTNVGACEPRTAYLLNAGTEFKGGKFGLLWNHRFPNQCHYKFQMHLSHFENLKEAFEVLQELWGPYMHVLLEAKIMRLDICIDIDVPIETIISTTTVKNKRVSIKSQTNRDQSISFGKVPERTRAYKKKKKRRKFDSWNVDPTLLPSDINYDPEEESSGTRIEKSYWGKRVPIKTLREIINLIDLRPFDDIAIFVDADEVDASQLPEKDQEKFYAYRYRALKTSAQVAKSAMNKNRNFNRNFKHILGLHRKLDLQEIYFRRLDKFFSGLAQPSSDNCKRLQNSEVASNLPQYALPLITLNTTNVGTDAIPERRDG